MLSHALSLSTDSMTQVKNLLKTWEKEKMLTTCIISFFLQSLLPWKKNQCISATSNLSSAKALNLEKSKDLVKNDIFSPKLIHDVAAAVATEVRAKHNYFVQTRQFGDHKGLGCFAPVINIMRHPLWGRNQVCIIFNSCLLFAKQQFCALYQTESICR